MENENNGMYTDLQ